MYVNGPQYKYRAYFLSLGRKDSDSARIPFPQQSKEHTERDTLSAEQKMGQPRVRSVSKAMSGARS